MRHFSLMAILAAFIAVTVTATVVMAQNDPATPPPQGHDGGGAPGAGGPGGRGGHDGGPGGGFHVLPPFVIEKLNLTDDQKKQIADLEKEVKAKLDTILTDEQKKTLSEARPQRRPGGDAGQGGQGARGGGQTQGQHHVPPPQQ